VASPTTAPPARRRLLLVHAHPDDETLATGGTIARYAADPDTSVTLVTCTLGEQGEVIPAGLAMLVAEQADQLGGYRIGELAGACAALGLTDHRFLGGVGRWRDSGMVLAGHGVRAATPERLHPRALARPEAFAEQVDALVEVLAEVRPQVVVTYAADGGYGHPDHVRAHQITVAALARVPARLACTVVSRSALDAGVARLACAVRPAPPVARPRRAARRRRRGDRRPAGRHRAAGGPGGRAARPRHPGRGLGRRGRGRPGRLGAQQRRGPAAARRGGVRAARRPGRPLDDLFAGVAP
jgi:N-acetyl-1-D-myo-inositol-2-amino-2-deoxy-alpha-D-glucopyranoside deacetylase